MKLAYTVMHAGVKKTNICLIHLTYLTRNKKQIACLLSLNESKSKNDSPKPKVNTNMYHQNIFKRNRSKSTADN